MNDESQILEGYLPKLIRLAERNLSTQLRSKVDAEEVSATVMRTVIRQAREGKILVEQSEGFWKLLVVITLNKVRKKARYWKAQKRDVSREQPVADEGPQLAELAVDFRELPLEPSQEDGDTLAEIVTRLTEQLDEKHQNVLAAKLEGKTNEQIAIDLGVSPRSVTRYIQKIQMMINSIDPESD